MDIQLPLINFDEAKAKLVEVLLTDLPANEELLSANPSREFVQDILDHGQLVPIHLNKLGKGKYEVIAGRRRIKAFRELAKIQPENPRWKTIKALVVEVTGETAILAASVENNRRSQNVLTDIAALQYLRTNYPGISIAELARSSGMSQGTVKARLRIADHLDPVLITALSEGQITTQVADAASKLPHEFQAKLIATLLTDKKLTMDDVVDTQRTRVQQTVDQQFQMDVELMVLKPQVEHPDKTYLYGYAVYSLVDHMCLTPVSDDENQIQADLEAYQARADNPADLVAVRIYLK